MFKFRLWKLVFATIFRTVARRFTLGCNLSVIHRSSKGFKCLLQECFKVSISRNIFDELFKLWGNYLWVWVDGLDFCNWQYRKAGQFGGVLVRQALVRLKSLMFVGRKLFLGFVAESPDDWLLTSALFDFFFGLILLSILASVSPVDAMSPVTVLFELRLPLFYDLP